MTSMLFSMVLLAVMSVLALPNCEGDDSDACVASDNGCRWKEEKCVIDCKFLTQSRDCVENDCAFIVGNVNCRDKSDVIPCADFTVRAQCINVTRKECYWRPGGNNFVDRDNEGECLSTTDCSKAVNVDECKIFRNDYQKQCFFYDDSCQAASCNTFVTEEGCTRHGVPGIFCSWSNDTGVCTSSGAETCENSGALDHATCFIAKQKTGKKCFWRYDEGACIELVEPLTCSELNLEECEILANEYVDLFCKVQQSECRSVTPCEEVVGNEIDCISNSSETNPCFYLSSLPSSNGVGTCILRKDVTCDSLKTETKCYFHGIEGLFCSWDSSGPVCVKKSSCEAKSKGECSVDNSCFFAVDTESYFSSDTYNLVQDPAAGSCHTLSSTNPITNEEKRNQHRNKCKYLVNPTQCNIEAHVETRTTEEGEVQEVVQDCLYSICASTADANCEGKCVPWSMHHLASDPNTFLEMDNPDDCNGIMNGNQCNPGFLRTTGPNQGKSFCLWGVQHCYALKFKENNDVIYEANCSNLKDATACGGADADVCIWIDNSCKVKSTSSCETVTNLDDDTCNNVRFNNQKSSVTDLDSYTCHKYEAYFEPGYQEVVQYRCKEKIADCVLITDVDLCNDAGSGDGQTCFWLDIFDEINNKPGGKCIDPQNPRPLECSNFTASQCPVTDAQLLPFVGATRVCEIAEDGLHCRNSSFLSIPNYCAQYRYSLDGSTTDPRADCRNTGMCVAVDVIEGEEGEAKEGVCVPDSANTPTCPLFSQSELCHYVDFTEGSTHVGINCEWLSLRGKSAGCVDASFVQCEDITDVVNECKAGLREKEEKCLVDEQQCKINRCSSATIESNCDKAQNGGCEWSDNTCIKRTCGNYTSGEECPEHCDDSSSCKTFEKCEDVSDSDDCPKKLPVSGTRCYWNGVICTAVTSLFCNNSTIKEECENMKPNDGYGCIYKEPESESGPVCLLAETVSCQGILPNNPEQCHPGNVTTATESTKRLFAHFSEWCDYNGNTDPKSCQPKCAAIENDEDCLRESTNCDLFVGHKCRSRFFTNGESSNCASAGFLECKYQCRWVDNATGCEAIPEPPDADNTSMTRAVIIGSVIGGVVIILLVVGIIVVILLYMRMKKKHAEEEERLRREAEEAENEEDGALGGSGEENKNVNMDANPSSSGSTGGDGGDGGGW